MGRSRRRKAQPTDDWQELVPLFEWPEQQAYEEIRPLVLFGSPVTERARETGTPERTMYRRVERFEKDGMLSLFATDPSTARARRRGLEPAIRRMIVELKAEHPKLNANEISNIVYVRTGRRLGKHTPVRVLAEEVVPLKLSRLFEPYHETVDVREAREAVVTLHLDGWSVKSIASYLKVSRTTVYRALGIRKLEIEKGQPWQSYLESGWNVQRRIADYYFASAEDWSELLAEHNRWMADYNLQEHYAHQHRKDGRRSPSEVLSWVKRPRFREEDLERAFFVARHTRIVDGLGYLTLQRYRLYAEEELAGTEVAVWVAEDELTVEHDGEALSRYTIECDPVTGTGAVGRLRRIMGHALFETSIVSPQLRLFDLSEVLGEEGWTKFLKLDEYAPRQPRHPDELQQVLFARAQEEKEEAS